jgi:hypothetical protein
MSIVDAISSLKEHQIETDKNLTSVMKFLTEFSAKTLGYIRYSDIEIIEIKSKAIKDLQKLDRSVEERIKASKMITEELIAMETAKMESEFLNVKSMVNNCETKVDNCEPAISIIESVNLIYKDSFGTL